MARKIALADLVTEPGLKKLVGPKYFERGVDYFHRETVERLRADDREIVARVMGTELYRSRLWITRGKLNSEMTANSASIWSQQASRGLRRGRSRSSAEADTQTLADNADLEWRKAGFWPGTDLASAYGVPNHLKRFRRFHVRLEWRDTQGKPLPISGPTMPLPEQRYPASQREHYHCHQ